MNKEIREFLEKIKRGELSELSISKQASAFLDKYNDKDYLKLDQGSYFSKDYKIIRITYNEDYSNTELLLVKSEDVERTLKFINQSYKEFTFEQDDDDEEDWEKILEEFEYVHNYIEFQLDNYSNIPHVWLTYEEVDMKTFF